MYSTVKEKKKQKKRILDINADNSKYKIKSGIIVFGFILVVTLVIYYIAMALDFSGPMAIFIALTFFSIPLL